MQCRHFRGREVRSWVEDCGSGMEGRGLLIDTRKEGVIGVFDGMRGEWIVRREISRVIVLPASLFRGCQ